MAVALALLAAMSALSSCTSPATAELTRLEHPVAAGAPLRLLVVGDWGRKGGYNQTRVAEQVILLSLHQTFIQQFNQRMLICWHRSKEEKRTTVYRSENFVCLFVRS